MINKYIQYIQQNPKPELVSWVNKNLNNYLKKKPHKDNQTKIEHILDFLMSDEAPKRMNKLAFKDAKKKAKVWTEKLQAKGNEIVETEEDIETVHDFGDGFRLVKLVSESSYQREGNLMRHCVASYFGKKEVQVFSLRDEFNKPHATFDTVRDGDKIQQIKGKGNGCIHPKYIKYVLKALELTADMSEIRSHELANLGYIHLDQVTEGLTKFIKKNFGESAKFATINGQEYMYKFSKLKRVK